MTETQEQTPMAPMTVLRRIVPWIVLAFVVFRVFSLFGSYRTSQAAWEAETGKPTLSEVASAAAAAAAKKPAASGQTSETAGPSSKVVIVSDVTLRKDPSSNAQPVRDLKTGEQLTYLGQLGPWYKVTDKSGRTGWVSASERYTKVVADK